MFQSGIAVNVIIVISEIFFDLLVILDLGRADDHTSLFLFHTSAFFPFRLDTAFHVRRFASLRPLQLTDPVSPVSPNLLQKFAAREHGGQRRVPRRREFNHIKTDDVQVLK